MRKLISFILIGMILFGFIHTEPKGEDVFIIDNGVLTGYTGRAKEVVIPGNVTKIQSEVFRDNLYIESVRLPQGISVIEERAFFGCTNLESINLPQGIIKIGNRVFNGCSNLKSITIPQGVTEIENFTFNDCYSLNSVIIPDSVTQIGAYAFSNSRALTSIVLPDSVEKIGEYAFNGCSSLEDIELSRNLKVIELAAFQGCAKLKSITVPEGVKEIEEAVFKNCISLETVILPDGLERIGWYAFSNCKSLAELRIPDSVVAFGVTPFEDCNVTLLVGWASTGAEYAAKNDIPYVVPEPDQESAIIEGNVFKAYLGQEETYDIPDHVTVIWKEAFKDNQHIKNIAIPDTVTHIGSRAFYNCISLESINIPAELKTLEKETFYGCSSIEQIVIPRNVTFMEEDIFIGCPNITVYGDWDSFARSYCEENSIPFGFLTTPPPTLPPTPTPEATLTPDANDIPLEEIRFDKSKLYLKVKGKTKLEPIFTPENASDKSIIWKTNKAKVAKVSKSGLVTGKSLGKAKITVSNAEGTLNASCRVFVVRPVKRVKINKKKIILKKGKKRKLKAIIKPKKASIKTVTWTSKNKKVAKVNKKGVIRALKKGKATIIAKSITNNKKAKCQLIVK